MMLFPIRTDRPLRDTPYVNYALIAANVVVFLATFKQIGEAEVVWGSLQGLSINELWNRYPVLRFYLWTGEDTRLFQFITSQFLHQDPLHLIGNMVFLWVFGNNVEDRLGKFGYLFFYLAAGTLAGVGHWLTSDAAALGASGAVAGVTGAFFALFPRTRITIFFWFFFFIHFFEIQATWVVLFFFAKDLFFYTSGYGGVAYTAHLAGTLAGFGFGMSLLFTRLLPREPYDLLSLLEHRRRRQKFRKISRDGYQAWDGKHEGRNGKAAPPQDPAVLEARRAIAQAAGDHDLPRAAALYADLLQSHPDQVLSERLQTDVANQLFGDGRHAQSAEAYRLLLQTYPRHPDKADLQLILGLIYSRYLGRPGDAKPLLEQASERLSGDAQAHAKQLLASLPAG